MFDRLIHTIRPFHGPTWWLTACLLLACALMSPLSGDELPPDASGIDPKLPVLQSIGQIYAVRSTPLEQQIHRVDMEVHVAYFDPEWNNIYLQSSDVPAQNFLAGGTREKLLMGDVVRLEGTVRPAAPLSLADYKVTRVARDRPLKPTIIDGNFPEILRLEQRVVRAQAFVERQFETDPTHLELHLIIEGVKVRGRLVLGSGAPVPDLAGYLTTIDGVLVPQRQPSPEFLAEFWIGSVDAIQSHGLAAESPLFDLPVTEGRVIGRSPRGSIRCAHGSGAPAVRSR